MYPKDCLQCQAAPWWIEDNSSTIERGRLLWAFVPHVDQEPYVLIPEGRSNPREHASAIFRIEPSNIRRVNSRSKLPVSALPQFSGEIWAVYRAKKRPVLVVGQKGPDVPRSLRTGSARFRTAPTFLVAPYYGCDRTGKRGSWRREFLKRVRRCHYPQYLWDILPISSTTKESILRLDHIQPLSTLYVAYELTPYRLSDDAMVLLEEYVDWLLTGTLGSDSILELVRSELLKLP